MADPPKFRPANDIDPGYYEAIHKAVTPEIQEDAISPRLQEIAFLTSNNASSFMRTPRLTLLGHQHGEHLGLFVGRITVPIENKT